MNCHELVVILDFGSQYTQLIARRIREHNVYCKILPWTVSAVDLVPMEPSGLIFSGGPASVGTDNAPTLHSEILDLPCPKLGICYGLQITAHTMGERLISGSGREYGRARLEIDERNVDCLLLNGVPNRSMVWMSHGDSVASSKNIEALASTDDCSVAIARVKEKNFLGLQFHPEVSHTEYGSKIIENFLFLCCELKGDWQLGDVVEQSIEAVAKQVEEGSAVIGLSGGVDSSVTAAICQRAIGNRAHAVFVDNGLLRAGEREEVERAFEGTDLDLRVVDAEELFLKGPCWSYQSRREKETYWPYLYQSFPQRSRENKGCTLSCSRHSISRRHRKCATSRWSISDHKDPSQCGGATRRPGI